ncbi:MAG: T9SS type A sorting domain-containing protein [Bacteroides sp.]
MKNMLRRMLHSVWVVALLTLFFAGVNTAWGQKIKVNYTEKITEGTTQLAEVKVQGTKFASFPSSQTKDIVVSGKPHYRFTKYRVLVKPADGYQIASCKVTAKKDDAVVFEGQDADFQKPEGYDFKASSGFDLKKANNENLEYDVVVTLEKKTTVNKYKIIYQNPTGAHGKLTIKEKSNSNVVAEGTEGAEFAENTEFLFEVAPDDGYALEKLEVVEGSSAAPRILNPDYIYTLQQNATFTATFKEVFTVSSLAAQGGRLTLLTENGNALPLGNKVFKGTKIKLSNKNSYGAQAGYELVSVTKQEKEDASPVAISNDALDSYTLEVKSDVTFAATYKKAELKLTIGSYKIGAEKHDFVEVWYNGEKLKGDKDNAVKLPYNALVTVKPIAPEALKGKFAGGKLGNIVMVSSANVETYLKPSQTVRLLEDGSTITATYGEEVTLKLPKPENGTLKVEHDGKTVENDAKFIKGTVLHLTFAPAENYKLKGALVNGEEKELKILKVTYVVTPKSGSNECTLGALFEPKVKYKVTYTGTVDGGSFEVKNGSNVVASGTELYEGTELTFNIKPNTGKMLDAFRKKYKKADGTFGEGVTVTPTAPYTLDKELEFVATFRDKKKYSIIVKDPANGTLEVMADGVKVNSGQKYDEGAKLTFTAKANNENTHKLEKVYDKGSVWSNITAGTVLRDNMVITAFFRPFHNLKVFYEKLANVYLTVKKENGTEEVASGTAVREDSKLKFVLSNEHYDFVYLSANGADIEKPGDLFTLTDDVTLDYAVTKKLYKVSYEKRASGAKGELTVKVKDGDVVAPDTKLPYETELVFETKADENYKLEKITVESATVTAPYKLEKDVTFVASFVEKTKYKVKYEENPANGKLEVQRRLADGTKKKVAPNEDVYEGTELYFVATPTATTHVLDKLMANDKEINPTLPYVLTAQVEFKATFGEKKNRVRLDVPTGVTLEIKDAQGGVVTPDVTDLTKDQPLKIKVTATTENLGVKKITFAGKDITSTLADGVYTATMVDGIAYISVVLNQKYSIKRPSPLPDGVTAIKILEGTTVVAEGTKVEEGKTLTVEVTSTRTVKGIKLGDNDAELKNGKWTVVMPSADAELKVTLKPQFAITFNVNPDWGTGATISVKDGEKDVTTGALVEEGKKLTVKVNVPKRTVKSVKLGNNSGTLKDGSFEVEMPAEAATLEVNLVAQYKVGFYNGTPAGVNYEVFFADGTTRYANNSLVDAGTKLLVKVITDWTVLGVSRTLATAGTSVDYETKNSAGLYEIEVPEENSTIQAKLKPRYPLSYTAGEGISNIKVTYKGTQTEIKNGAEVEQGKELTISFNSANKVASISLGNQTVTTPVKEDKDFGEFVYTYEVSVSGPNAKLLITTVDKALSLEIVKDEASIQEGDVLYTTEPDGDALKALGEGSRVTIRVTKLKAGYTLKATSTEAASVSPLEISETPKSIVVTMGKVAAKVKLSLALTEYPLTIPSDIENITFKVTKKDDNSEVTTGTKFAAGTKFVVEVTVSKGSPVTFLTINNESVAKGADGKFTFEMPAKPVTLGVLRENELKNYTLTFPAASDEYQLIVKQGDTQLSDKAEVQVGKPLTFTITVKSGLDKKVNKVTLAGIEATKTDATTWTINMPNQDASIAVELQSMKRTLTFPESSASYSLVVRKEGKTLSNKDLVEVGAELTITTTVFTTVAKKVTKVMVGSAEATTTDGRTWKVKMPDEDATIAVTLIDVKRMFTFADTEEYTVTATKDGQPLTSPAGLDANDKVEVTITVKPGVNKTVEKVNVGATVAKELSDKPGVYAFTMPNTDAELRVTLANPKHQLFIGKQEGVTISVNQGLNTITSGDKVEEGVTLTVKVKTTKEIASVLLNDVAATLVKENEYEVLMPKEDAVLMVQLKGVEKMRVLRFETSTPEYTVVAHVQTEEAKPVELINPAQVAVGAKVTLTITMKNGVAKYVKAVKVGDSKVMPDVADAAKWSFDMPDANVILEVETAAIDELTSHKITVVANGAEVQIFDGTRALAVNSEVKTNTVLTIKVTHVTHKIEKVTFGGRALTLEHGEYKAIMPDADVTLEVTLGGEKTSVEDALLAAVTVSPNPFVGELRIANFAGANGRYELLTLSGQLLRAGSLDAETTVVETSDLPQGLYFLQITTQSGASKAFRVVKY